MSARIGITSLIIKLQRKLYRDFDQASSAILRGSASDEYLSRIAIVRAMTRQGNGEMEIVGQAAGHH